jgi:hypothetical protein
MKLYLYIFVSKYNIEKKDIIKDLLFDTANIILEFDNNTIIDIFNINDDLKINYKVLYHKKFDLLSHYNKILLDNNNNNNNKYYVILTEEEDEELRIYEEIIEYINNFDDIEVEININYYKEKTIKEIKQEIYIESGCNVVVFNRKWKILEEFIEEFKKRDYIEKYKYKDVFIEKLENMITDKFITKILI